MALARLIRWLALAAAVVGLSAPLVIPRISAHHVSWAGAFSLTGLVLDILGAVLLSWTVVKQPADEIAAAPFLYAWGTDPRLFRDPFLWVALRLGGRLVVVIPGRPLAAFEDGLSGVLLLILGFLGQAVGQAVSMLS